MTPFITSFEQAISFFALLLAITFSRSHNDVKGEKLDYQNHIEHYDLHCTVVSSRQYDLTEHVTADRKIRNYKSAHDRAPKCSVSGHY
ncbi:hypothetical protein TYRP_003288, partial [Tyrophagus putrescentiae]